MGITGLERPHRPLALLAVAEAEARLVEEAHLVERLPLDVETDADPGRQARVGAARPLLDPPPERLDAPAGGESVGREEAGERADRGAVRERRRRRDLGRRVGRRLELLEPAGGRLGVAVQEHHVARRERHAAVDRGDEAPPLGARRDDDARRPGAVAPRRVDERRGRRRLRPVERQDQPVPREIGVGDDALDAARQRLCGAADRHDDVDRPRRRIRRHAPRVAGQREGLAAHRGLISRGPSPPRAGQPPGGGDRSHQLASHLELVQRPGGSGHACRDHRGTAFQLLAVEGDERHVELMREGHVHGVATADPVLRRQAPCP